MDRSNAILERLLTLHPREIDLSLERVERLMADLGHPEHHLPPVIHVAGTNGKGSVVAMVETALRAAGHRTGRYTSPHLLDLSERFAIDGRPIERPALEAAASDLQSAVDRLMARGRLQAPPRKSVV